MYTYNCKLVRVIDGDTVNLDVDLGFGLRHHITLRLHGINTPECRGVEKQEGERVKHELTDFLLGKNIEVATGTAKRSFGRSVGILYANGINVNDWLVENGYAEEVDHA